MHFKGLKSAEKLPKKTSFSESDEKGEFHGQKNQIGFEQVMGKTELPKVKKRPLAIGKEG